MNSKEYKIMQNSASNDKLLRLKMQRADRNMSRKSTKKSLATSSVSKHH